MATYFATVPNIYGEKHEVLSHHERVQESIREANNSGIRQKHPDEILGHFSLWLRISHHERVEEVEELILGRPIHYEACISGVVR
jgi:hypothetical protein